MSSESFLIKLMGLAIGIILISHATNGDSITLFDFSTISNLDDWSEQSDTVRTAGRSKATLVLETAQDFQQAVFFTLLNVLPDGSGFAGVRTSVSLDLSAYEKFTVTARAQGNNSNYKIVLRHRDLISNSDPTYEAFFEVPISNVDYYTVDIPFSDFTPYFRGQELSDTEALDTSDITIFGLQMYAGVFLPIEQSGVSSLEIDNISVTGS